MNATIAITGTSGYSGRYIAHEAAGRGYCVLGLTNSPLRAAAAILGQWQGDVMLTRDEIRGLMEDRLAVDGAPGHGRSLRDWLRAHADELGHRYASELARRR